MLQQSRQEPIILLWNVLKDAGEQIDPRAGSINGYMTESNEVNLSDIVMTPIELMKCSSETELNIIGKE